MSQSRIRFVDLVIVGLVCSNSTIAATRFVVSGAAPGGDGLSWATAHDSLTNALNNSQAGDEIWVAAGTYVPGVTRQSAFELRSGVAIYGGFTGSETVREQRNSDPTTNLCTLSGDVDADDAPKFGNRADNNYHVVAARTVDEGAVLDGFTIRGGHAVGVGNNDRRGGGYFGTDSNAILRNCRFTDNHAANAGGGAACFFLTPRFEHCTFDGNRSDTVGGAFHAGSANPTLIACVFRFNQSTSGGAASASTAHVYFDQCELTGNAASNVGGAALATSNGSLTLSACILAGNSANGDGGAIWHLGQTLTAMHCVFADNASGACGGAVFLYAAYGQISGCRFLGNSALEGGALATSAEVFEAVLRSCEFSGNFAGARGGAIAARLSGTLVRVVNCSFAANNAPMAGGIGVSDQARLELESSVLWGNTDQQGGGHLAQVRADAALLSIVYSDIEGLLPEFQHNSNFDLAPAFVNPLGADGAAGTLDDDLHLLPTSPCIARGSWTAFGVNEYDIDGEPRVMGGRIDVGADEFTDRPFVFGDLDCDGVRNNFDIDPFVLALTGSEAYAESFPDCDARNADINADGLVNNFDIDPFVGLLSLP
ncbi:MAG: hypothetical protein JNG88_08020 [Phycisphaerales bacterium]|nr:hypothetical protein [Phycisphaerales bacterium]